MLTPKDFWEDCFKQLTIESYDFLRSKPASVLPEYCQKYLDRNAVVLDLGCGSGRNTHYLAQEGFQVYGLDVASRAIEFCQARFAQFNLTGVFKQGSLEYLPFPDDFFSSVICIAAMDHVTFESARTAISEIRRTLSPNGTILLTFDPPDQDEDIIVEAEVLPDGTLKFMRGDQAGMLFRRYSDEEITSLLGEEHIISFDYGDYGERVIISR